MYEPNFSNHTLIEVIDYLNTKEDSNSIFLAKHLTRLNDFEMAFWRTEIIWAERIRGR